MAGETRTGGDGEMVTGAASPARGDSTLVGYDGEMVYRGRVLLFRIFKGG